MIYKLVNMTPEEIAKHKLEELHGKGYSTIPQGMRKALIKDGLGQLGHYTPLAIEYRQAFKCDNPNYWPFGDAPCAYGHYFFFHNRTGIAFLWTGSDSNKASHGYAWWEFGCPHKKTKAQNVGNCLNTYTCQDCGYEWTVDSSG